MVTRNNKNNKVFVLLQITDHTIFDQQMRKVTIQTFGPLRSTPSKSFSSKIDVITDTTLQLQLLDGEALQYTKRNISSGVPHLTTQNFPILPWQITIFP